jgi:hypothetical protein
MPDTLDVKCPNCAKVLKVPAQLAGKKVKCKGCDTAFPVPAPGAKPAAAAGKPVAAPPPEPVKTNPFADDEDELDEQGRVKAMEVLKESDVPRCPHCTVELDPPDAKVCYRCGFNNVTRIKAETKKVIAADATDWMSHLGPGILALILVVILVVIDIICYANMREWMVGSWFEEDEKDILGNKKMLVKPGAFIALIIAFSIIGILPLGRFAFKRLVLDYKPEEKVKK